MPNAVYKTTGNEAVDAYYADNLVEHLDEAAELLAGNLLDAVNRFAEEGFMPGDEVERFEGGWPSSAAASKLLQHGYAQAVALARAADPPVPIESFFVSGTGEDFEVHVCEGPRCITVFTFVPHGRDYGSKRAAMKTWVVRIGDHPGISGEMPREVLDDSGEFPVLKIQMSGEPPG